METFQCGLTLADVERKYILETLECCHGNRTRAATLLNISIRCLRTKLHEYAEAGCAVRAPHTELRHVECEQAKSLAAFHRGH